MSEPKGAQGKVAPRTLRDALHKIILDEGEAEAAKRLGMNRTTLMRVVAGFPVREGTIASVRAKLKF